VGPPIPPQEAYTQALLGDSDELALEKEGQEGEDKEEEG
jgi:hypothetical protein